MPPRDRNPRETGDSGDDRASSRERSLTPPEIGIPEKVAILSSIVERQEDDLASLKRWRQRHETLHAERDGILLGDEHRPGQLDRIETSITELKGMAQAHAKEDEKMFKAHDERLTKSENFDKALKIRISTTVAVVSFLALTAQAVLGWLGILPH